MQNQQQGCENLNLWNSSQRRGRCATQTVDITVKRNLITMYVYIKVLKVSYNYN